MNAFDTGAARPPPAPGSASFFYRDARFASDAVKLLPGEHYACGRADAHAAGPGLLLATTLGSCIAACLWDRHARVGGMNHFLLPAAGGSTDGASGRYGAYAMELLVNELLKRGATRATLEAKVFGGGQVVSGMTTLNVGERNTAFVLDYLAAERIPVLAQDVLGAHARKVCFFPASGRALVKRLPISGAGEALAADERAAARQSAPASAAGSIDLF